LYVILFDACTACSPCVSFACMHTDLLRSLTSAKYVILSDIHRTSMLMLSSPSPAYRMYV
jgi:hypothetical protein